MKQLHTWPSAHRRTAEGDAADTDRAVCTDLQAYTQAGWGKTF